MARAPGAGTLLEQLLLSLFPEGHKELVMCRAQEGSALCSLHTALPLPALHLLLGLKRPF